MLKKWMACVSALLVTASLSCSILTANAEDKEYDTLLKNPSLEDLNEDGTTTFWDVWPGNPAEGEKHASVSNDVVHSGKNSLKIDLTTKNNQAVYQYHLAADKRFPFAKEYTFSFWVKMEGVTPSDADGIRIGVNRKGADGNGYDLRESIEVGTYDWTKVSITVPRALVGLVQYDVIVDIGRGTGTMYIDDFELVEGSGTPAPTDPVTPDDSSKPDTPDDPSEPNKPDDPSSTPADPAESSNPAESSDPASDASKPGDTSNNSSSSKPATTKADPVNNNKTDDGGFNALPLIIVIAVVVAGAAVVVAVLIIREKKKKQTPPQA